MASEVDVDRAVDAARAALEGPWAKTPPNERSRLLHALADAIVANRKELADLEARNVGKAITSVKGGDRRRGRALPLLRLRDRVDRRSLEPDRRLAPLLLAEGASRRLRSDRPLELPAPDDDVEARARARGRLHDRAEARSADAAHRAPPRGARGRGRLPAGRDQHRPGRRPDDGRVPRQHPGVDKVAFTGSTKTGGEIMRLCSDPIKRLTLELGGKSPNLVFADADLADAIPSAAWSIYYLRRPELRGALAPARRAVDLRRRRLGARRQGRRAQASATRSTPRRRSAR